MTVKKTISIPDRLNSLIEEYNVRHPFENLVLSQVAQKAIFEKIKADDPELVAMMSGVEHAAANATLTPGAQVTATAPLAAKEIEVEEEPEQLSQEVPQHVPIQKTKKTDVVKFPREIVCENCGKKVMAKRKTKRFCSKNCVTAYERKQKKVTM